MYEIEKLRSGKGCTTNDAEISASPCLPLSVSSHLRISPFPRPRVLVSPLLLLIVACLMFTVSCRQDMQDQPRMKALRSTSFFPNGMSSRAPVTGTVPRGYLRADREFFTGKKSTAGTSATAAPPPAAANATASPTAVQGVPTYPDDVEEFPLPITAEVVKRGRQRYDIFCSACHGMTGSGDGMIVRRGFRRAASFHSVGLRQAPVGHYFDAITNGWATMPSYAAQIPTADRWAIVAYIRALQLSQQNTKSQTGEPSPAATQTATPSSGGHN